MNTRNKETTMNNNISECVNGINIDRDALKRKLEGTIVTFKNGREFYNWLIEHGCAPRTYTRWERLKEWTYCKWFFFCKFFGIKTKCEVLTININRK